MTRNVLLFMARNKQGGPRVGAITRVVVRNVRTIAAYTLKPRYRQRRRNRDARLLALRDAVLGRWGKMGPDVTTLCYGKAG